MLGVLIAMALMSGACTYLVGYAFIAPRHSFLRSQSGGVVLGVAVVFAIIIAPSLAPFITSPTFGGWPPGLGADAYHTLRVALMAVGLLSGMRVWRMRFGRGAGSLSFDESPASRVRGQLPLADTLTAALDVFARENPSAKDIARLTDTITAVGTRFWHQLPEKDSDVYNLVRGHVSPTVAADVTRLLLEGAARKG
ncbi:MAG: hypothetical protein ACYC77_07235 [Coriobacteriia bacterium]